MTVSTAAGATLSIGTTAAVGATDTFTVIGEVTALPEFGRVYAAIKYTPLSNRGVQKFKGSYDDGALAVTMGKDLTDAGQAALVVALDADQDYNFKIIDNDVVAPAVAIGVSMTAATPGVVTDTAHGLAVNTPIKLVVIGGGVLPTGIVSGTTYYVKTVASADTYTLSATPGGTVINTTGSPSGTYTRTTVPAGSYQVFKAKVMSHTTKRDSADNVIMSTVSLEIKSGSIAETVRIPAS